MGANSVFLDYVRLDDMVRISGLRNGQLHFWLIKKGQCAILKDRDRF